MGFYLRRYLAALRRDWRWGALAVLAAVALYLLIAAFGDPRWVISQDVAVSGEVVVAAADSPVDTLPLSELVEDPDELFLEPFALHQLRRELELGGHQSGVWSELRLGREVRATLSLKSLADDRLRLGYRGQDRRFGYEVVGFFGQRLLARVERGAKRVSTVPRLGASGVALDGRIRVSAERGIWAPGRLLPALWVFSVSMLGVLVLIGLRELADPAFKSERQVARYLGTAVLGAIPDAGPMLGRLTARPFGPGPDTGSGTGAGGP